MDNLKNEIKNISIKDKVIVEGSFRNIRRLGTRLSYFTNNKGWINFDENSEEIQGVEKYFPKMYYDGSSAYVEAYAMDNEGNLIYLELSGQEQHVRSISALILQGKTKLKDKILYSDEVMSLNVIPNGNRRILQSLGDGIADAIVYNSHSLTSQDLNMLIGKTEEKIYEEFLRFLKIGMKYPTHFEYNKELFERLKEKNLIFRTNSFNHIAYAISKELLNEDCLKFREEVILLLKEKNLIGTNNPKKETTETKKEKYNYAKSKYLDHKQVVAIYKKLEELPNVYETDGISVKEKVVKIFGPTMTYYIVESNKSDEWYEPFERCYAYVKNETNPEDSEWGYVSVPEILERAIPMKITGINIPDLVVGYEMDLYFENKCIDRTGRIFDKEEIIVM